MSRKSYQLTPELDKEQEEAVRLFMLDNGSTGEHNNVFREPASAPVPTSCVQGAQGGKSFKQVGVRLSVATFKRFKALKDSGIAPYNYASLALTAAVNDLYEKNADAIKAWKEENV